MTDIARVGMPDETTEAFRDAARRWFESMAGPDAFRRHCAGSRTDNRSAWEAFRGFGLDEILLDAAVEDRARAAAAVGIEAGRALFAGPIVEGSAMALCGGTPGSPRLAVWAPLLARGPEHAQVALTRAGNGIDRVSGSVAAVPYVDLADTLLLPVRNGVTLVLASIALESPGVEVTALLQVDGSCIADVTVECPTSSDSPVVDASSSSSLIPLVDDLLLLATSARLIGVAERAAEIARDYLGARRQFGRVLGSFQALQHRAVDGHVDLTLANALLWRLVADWGRLAHRRALLLALKSLASRTAMKVARDGVQFFGGMGFSDEGPIGVYLKHAMVLAARYGSETGARKRFTEHAVNLLE